MRLALVTWMVRVAVVLAIGGCGGREASHAPLTDAGDARGTAVFDVATPEASPPSDSSAPDDSSAMDEGPESDAPDEAYVELSPVLACLIPTFLRTDSGGSNSGCQAVPAAQDCFPVGGAYVTADGAVRHDSLHHLLPSESLFRCVRWTPRNCGDGPSARPIAVHERRRPDGVERAGLLLPMRTNDEIAAARQ